ncbi:MAG TPA: hypothetical protein VHX15_03930 [Frankiaceae bacterium]|jgi:hypothetical protein|nr:hypothetical protein [Frankiaceae bacterium]
MKVVLAPLVGERAVLVERQGELVLILDSSTSRALAAALRRVLAPVRGTARGTVDVTDGAAGAGSLSARTALRG